MCPHPCGVCRNTDADNDARARIFRAKQKWHDDNGLQPCGIDGCMDPSHAKPKGQCADWTHYQQAGR